MVVGGMCCSVAAGVGTDGRTTYEVYTTILCVCQWTRCRAYARSGLCHRYLCPPPGTTSGRAEPHCYILPLSLLLSCLLSRLVPGTADWTVPVRPYPDGVAVGSSSALLAFLLGLRGSEAAIRILSSRVRVPT